MFTQLVFVRAATDVYRRSGTPQVILSPWLDCHDMAVKAEWLGVGVWGNRHHA
jgi:hypothetical protein